MQRSLKLWPQANSGQYQTMGALKKLQDQSHGVVETSTSMSKHVAALHIYTIDTNSQQLQRNCSAKMQRNWRCNGRLPAWKRFCWNDNCGPGLSKVLDVTNLYIYIYNIYIVLFYIILAWQLEELQPRLAGCLQQRQKCQWRQAQNQKEVGATTTGNKICKTYLDSNKK